MNEIDDINCCYGDCIKFKRRTAGYSSLELGASDIRDIKDNQRK